MDPAKIKTKAAISKAFGNALKEARLNKGLSQEQLALQSGIDRTYVGMLERGTRHPSLAFLFAISPTLGTTPVELTGRVQKFLKMKS